MFAVSVYFGFGRHRKPLHKNNLRLFRPVKDRSSLVSSRTENQLTRKRFYILRLHGSRGWVRTSDAGVMVVEVGLGPTFFLNRLFYLKLLYEVPCLTTWLHDYKESDWVPSLTFRCSDDTHSSHNFCELPVCLTFSYYRAPMVVRNIDSGGAYGI